MEDFAIRGKEPKDEVQIYTCVLCHFVRVD
jgi:hypothetical protein